MEEFSSFTLWLLMEESLCCSKGGKVMKLVVDIGEELSFKECEFRGRASICDDPEVRNKAIDRLGW